MRASASPFTVTGLTLTVAQAGDYSLTPTTTTAGITPASLSVTGITADDKVYDSRHRRHARHGLRGALRHHLPR